MKGELSRKILAICIFCLFIVSFFAPSVTGADKLPPPVLAKPGEVEHLDTLTPTFEWEAVPSATKYGLYIYRYADEYWNIEKTPETWWIPLKIFDSISITGTSFDLPVGFLKSGIRYQWYMTSFSGEVEGDRSIVQSFSTSIANGGVRGVDVSKHQGRIDWDELCRWDDDEGRHMEFAYVRATYGIYNVIATIGANSEGEILYHEDNDISADGYEWWHVRFGDKTGWMAENGIEKLDNPADKEFVPGDKVKTVTSYKLRTLPGIIENGVIDERLNENMKGARAKGLLAGVYHFARPGLNDAVSEARHFVAVAGDYLKPGFLRPMLDLEEEGFDSEWVRLFIETVKQLTGAESLIYILPSWANDYLDDSVGVYDLWTTRPLYSPSCPPNYFPEVGAETSIRWDSWVIWQYGVTDKYSRNLPGVNADNLLGSYAVDLDVFNGDRAALEELLIAGYSPRALDVYMLVDLSGSFADDLPIFKVQASSMMSSLKTFNPEIRFGLGKFEDYPILPFGSASSGDKAYERVIDLTFDTNAVLSCILSLFTRYGVDGPQSQLPALYQAATGAGQDLSGVGFPGASIPPGQQANFRNGATKLFVLWTDAPFHNPGDPGTIPYPGPSFDDTVEAIKGLDPPMVIGISSGSGGVVDLGRMAVATGAIAPAGGVDINGDGKIDILEGQPLVAAISSSGYGIAEAIQSLVEAATVLPTADAKRLAIFSESGLLPSTRWSITLAGVETQNVMAGNTISFAVPDGTYSYTVGPISCYTASPSSGTIALYGENVNQPITFTITGAETTLLGVKNVVTLNNVSIVPNPASLLWTGNWTEPSSPLTPPAEESFSIQQNFLVEVPTESGRPYLYWVQNVIFVEGFQPQGWYAVGTARIFDFTAMSTSQNPTITSFLHQSLAQSYVALADNPTLGHPFSVPGTYTLSSYILGGQVIVSNDFLNYTWSIPAGNGRLTQNSSIVSGAAAAFLAPELVIVGPPTNTTAVAADVFLPPTSVLLQSYVQLAGQSWTSSVDESSIEYGSAATAEKSWGLNWLSNIPNGVNFTSSWWSNNQQGIFYSPVVPSLTEKGEIFEGQNSLTGVSVSISGSSVPDGTPVIITSAKLNGWQFSGKVETSPAAFYDVDVQGVSDGTATVSITNNGVFSRTTMEYWNGTQWLEASDVSASGNSVCGSIPVSALKVTLVVLGPVQVRMLGDLNGDDKVSNSDLVILANAYGSKPGDINWNPAADIEGNGKVGLSDLVTLAQHYGQHYP